MAAEGQQSGNIFSQVPTQNRYVRLEDDDEEEDILEEEAKRIEAKKKNEEGGRNKREEESRRAEESRRMTADKEKEVCKAFKFGGKCPHGMNGMRKYNQYERRNKTHPKVCNKLLAHGTRGIQGCDGRNCEKYHPKMCYSSMKTKVCTKEKCSYWHCKGTSFAPEQQSRYEAPSRASLGQYPRLPARKGRSPLRREH